MARGMRFFPWNWKIREENRKEKMIEEEVVFVL
jgi:hypothetical protein